MKSAPMVKQSNQVLTTKDYFMFKTIDGNRNINLGNLRRIKQSMTENCLYTVIIVNEDYEIIDGQHRFLALKELGLPVNYIICKGYGLPEVQRFNMNGKTWNSSDFLHGYCDLGYPEYLKYKEFKDKYGFGHYENMSLLGSTPGGSATAANFNSGKFKVKNYKKACENADKITMLAQFYPDYKRRSFVLAMIQLFNNPNFEFTEFVQKLKSQPTALINLPDTDDYISLIEEIYNYRRREKVNLRY